MEPLCIFVSLTAFALGFLVGWKLAWHSAYRLVANAFPSSAKRVEEGRGRV